MGYDVHITRAEDWTESKKTPITLHEWLTYVNADPEFRLDGFAVATTPQGESLRTQSEGLAVWTKYSKQGVGGNMAWFSYDEGEVVVKNPDEEILEKMRAVARSLRARLQGDDGEFYDEPGPPPRV